ncbi:MAG: 16S rRNA (guanine(966)-N(2))-methyltransferase RsmD [Candidatus Mycalebacterium zealandia]|nr:MAG: 16S rRNA (guanine(966)-N(2))-methyltransferase RsmD [Candidatus Mycalebacterium zealandia]
MPRLINYPSLFKLCRRFGIICAAMRVITGSAKGRKIKTAQKGVRPMAARVKKSVFDRLGDIAGEKVLDVFAGSGALGLEALSRGADSAVFVEKSSNVADIIAENIKQCGFESQCELIRSDYRKAAERLLSVGKRFDLIFIAPPYALFQKVSNRNLTDCFSPLLSENGRIVIEYETGAVAESENGAENRLTKKYGGTTVSILSPTSS